MDAQWVGIGLTAIVVTVSLAAFIRSELAGIRGDLQSLAQRHRQDCRTLSRQKRENWQRLEGAIDRLAEQHHEDFLTLSQQRREDCQRLERAIDRLAEQKRQDHGKLEAKLAEIAERTARVEGVIVGRWAPEF